MRIIKTTTFLLLWGLPVASYAQAPDLSLPPLPPLGVMGQTDNALSPLPGTTPTTVPPVTVTPGTVPSKSERASSATLDELIPPNLRPAAPTSLPATPVATDTTTTTPAASGSPTVAPTAPTNASLPPLPDTAATAALNTPATTPSLPAAPIPSTTASETAAPATPPSLEQEAAEAGVAPPPVILPPIPAATAQALLAGQSLTNEEEDDTPVPLPEPKTQAKPSWRDLPKLKPSFAPLRLTYNYQRQVLPPRIYRRSYDGDNYHLPRATMREDYDRHLFGAVAANDINATRAFLDMGKDVNMTNANGETLLVAAVRYGALNTLRLLLARGASPTLAGPNGVTPLSLAQSTGQRDMVLVLEARGAYASYQPQ